MLAVLRSRIGLAALAYAGASALSLVSLPIDEMAGSALDVGAWETAVTFATADVLDPLYSVRTVILLLNVLVVAVAVAVELRRDPGFARPLSTALLAGTAATVIVGLLDFHHVVDLRWLRSFDPLTNPSGVMRLQSTFGHSGWFAQ